MLYFSLKDEFLHILKTKIFQPLNMHNGVHPALGPFFGGICFHMLLQLEVQQSVENVDYAVEKTVDSFQIKGKEILLKIDIEGFECNLFKNFDDFFSKNTIHRVVNSEGVQVTC